MANALISFSDYDKENSFFMKPIRNRIEEVFRLRSEHAHQEYVHAFEEEFAAYNGSRRVFAVNSGTTALVLALKARGIGEGDEVIVPSYTYISTALAVSELRAIPVFVDICEDTLTIDPRRITESLSKKTKAVLPVHIHGNPCAMDRIMEIATENNLAVIEDCSHAHGAEYKGRKVGNFGIGCFSCHSSKFFSGVGNAGVITLNDVSVYERLNEMAKVENDPSSHLVARTPCRMDAVQAAVLRAKLPYLDKIIQKKRRLSMRYIDKLQETVGLQQENEDAMHVYRDFIIRHSRRELLQGILKNAGIETKVRYQTPVHLTKYYRSLPCKRGKLTVTERICDTVLCLPLSFTIAPEAVSRVCALIRRVEK